MKQLKRLTSVLLVLGMVLGLMPLSAFAAEPENTAEKTFPVTVSDNGGVDTYIFKLLADGTVELKKFSTTAKKAHAVIPSPVQEHPTAPEYSVTSIGNSAFASCGNLESVTLPDSIISIGTDAFSWCTALTTVNLGNSVVSIGTGAFGLCTALTTVNFGNSVVSIGDSAFVYTSLKSVTLPDSIVSIGAGAFSSCTHLDSVTIPSRVQTIGHSAFDYGSLSSKTKLGELHYTGTNAQWEELMKKKISYTDDEGSHTGSIRDLNPMLKNPENFDCAHTVSFDCGGKAEGTSKEVLYEGIVTPPDDPKADGYRFEGWYTQKDGGEKFDFKQEITEDVRVYAHWSEVKPDPKPDSKPDSKPDPKPNPNPDAKEYTLTEKDGTLVSVTVEKNGTTVDITKNVVLKQQGTTQIGKIPAGAMVTVAANAAPEGMVFAQWNISDPTLMGDPDVAHTSQTMTFPMPPADVTVEAMYESAENARETELLGSAAMIGAVGISAVVLAYQVHQLGTELYLKYLLPSGAAIPQNRIQLAELLWRNAGEPVPDVNAMYEDIGLNEEAAQQAAQWAVENELMELPDEEHTEQFKPDEQISYGEAIRAWKKAQQLKTAE